MPPSGRLVSRIPKAIGISSSGSKPFLMAKYNRRKETKIMIRSFQPSVVLKNCVNPVLLRNPEMISMNSVQILFAAIKKLKLNQLRSKRSGVFADSRSCPGGTAVFGLACRRALNRLDRKGLSDAFTERMHGGGDDGDQGVVFGRLDRFADRRIGFYGLNRAERRHFFGFGNLFCLVCSRSPSFTEQRNDHCQDDQHQKDNDNPGQSC